MRRQLTLGARSIAPIGIVLCFVVASVFSGCNLDDSAEADLNPPCDRPVPGPGTYTVIYHDPHDPEGTFRNIKGVIVVDTGSADHFINLDFMPVNCDHIESIHRTG